MKSTILNERSNIIQTNKTLSFSDFPLRLKTEGMNPSLGTLEIYKNNTWNKLCTPDWTEDENILTCMAIGYFDGSFYDNVWYNDHNNATIRRNCSSLTNCMNANREKPQLCKGICNVKIVNCAMLLS